jgi:hypothetical protein
MPRDPQELRRRHDRTAVLKRPLAEKPLGGVEIESLEDDGGRRVRGHEPTDASRSPPILVMQMRELSWTDEHCSPGRCARPLGIVTALPLFGEPEASKAELALVARTDPARIERIRQAEREDPWG